MKKKFKAAVLTELKKPLKITSLDMPTQLFPGQVLVKVFFSGICGSQIGEINGVKGEDAYLPHLLGHEGSGEVVKIGPGVSHVNPGDKVVLHWKQGVGIQSAPPKYKSENTIFNAGWVTTFNEYAVVSENRVTKIPDSLDLRVAALFGCAVLTGMGVVNNDVNVKSGQNIVVCGAGGVGLNIIQAAKLRSCAPIVGIDIHDSRLELAKKFGATHLINSKKQNIRLELNQLFPEGIDFFIDNTGNTNVIAEGYNLLNNSGTLVLVGVPRKGDNISIFSLPLHFGKQIIGSHGGSASPAMEIPRYINMYEKNMLQLNNLITHEIALDDINSAVMGMQNGDIVGRCLINLN